MRTSDSPISGARLVSVSCFWAKLMRTPFDSSLVSRLARRMAPPSSLASQVARRSCSFGMTSSNGGNARSSTLETSVAPEEASPTWKITWFPSRATRTAASGSDIRRRSALSALVGTMKVMSVSPPLQVPRATASRRPSVATSRSCVFLRSTSTPLIA